MACVVTEPSSGVAADIGMGAAGEQRVLVSTTGGAGTGIGAGGGIGDEAIFAD